MSLETVVERLKAKGPSGISPAQCWYCQRIEAWFRCDCPDVLAIRAGQKEPPRVVERKGQMYVILDEETIARNPGRKRYVPPKMLQNTGSRHRANQAITANSGGSPRETEIAVSADVEILTPAVAGEANPVNGEKPKIDRKTYMRELMRTRRAAAKGSAGA